MKPEDFEFLPGESVVDWMRRTEELKQRSTAGHIIRQTGTRARRLFLPEHMAPGSLNFQIAENAHMHAYPGGRDALVTTILSILTQHAQAIEYLFGPPPSKNLDVQWEPYPLPGAFVRMPTLYAQKKDSDSTVVRSFVQPTKFLRLLGTHTQEGLSNTVAHELGHIYLYPALPLVEPVQEAAACFVNEAVGAPGDGTFESECMKSPALIIEGNRGRGLGSFGGNKIGDQTRGILNASYLRGLLEACNDDSELLREVLQESKLLSLQNGMTTLDGEEVWPMPNLDEWITHINGKIPGFQERYERSSLGEEIAEGKHTLWHAHPQWGGILSSFTVRRNPQFLQRNERQALDIMRNVIQENRVKAQVQIPGLGISINVDAEYNFCFTSKMLRDAIIRQFPHLAYAPRLDMGQIILVPAGTQRGLQFVWDEAAERISRE